MNKSLIEIAPQEIDQKDRTFCLSYPVSPLPLALLIKETGFISPLILRKKGGEKCYQIVSGFKRMAALKNEVKKKIPAFVFLKKGLPNKKAILLSFYENLSQRNFNGIEKAKVLEKLLTLGKIHKERLIKFFLPLLGLPSNRKYLDDYLGLDQLEEPIKKVLAEGEISVDAGIILSKFRPGERKHFFSLIKRVHLNQTKAKIIFSLLQEISQREEKSISFLLKDKTITSSQDFSSLRNCLMERCYPEIKAHEKKFLNLVKSLKLPKEVKISPPPFFEDDRLRINLEIRQERELKKILSSLNRAFRNKNFAKILSML